MWLFNCSSRVRLQIPSGVSPAVGKPLGVMRSLTESLLKPERPDAPAPPPDLPAPPPLGHQQNGRADQCPAQSGLRSETLGSRVSASWKTWLAMPPPAHPMPQRQCRSGKQSLGLWDICPGCVHGLVQVFIVVLGQNLERAAPSGLNGPQGRVAVFCSTSGADS